MSDAATVRAWLAGSGCCPPGGVVYPAAGLAYEARGKVVIVNPEPTELDDAAHAVLRGKAAQLLAQMLAG